eukprot:TRINITY_DN1480_c0_g4_i1.p1 TRINITY_DN1480_c0_g4~~TRINITY_DN1480_c0_g4_i1.p1  ORF type:complete len:139 (+),score=31.83 TRINITY_DN1480_c0_g4_i1:43-417(+)
MQDKDLDGTVSDFQLSQCAPLSFAPPTAAPPTISPTAAPLTVAPTPAPSTDVPPAIARTPAPPTAAPTPAPATLAPTPAPPAPTFVCPDPETVASFTTSSEFDETAPLTFGGEVYVRATVIINA